MFVAGKRFALFRAGLNYPIQHLKPKQAQKLIDAGTVELIGERSVRLIENREIVTSSAAIRSSRQGIAYELAAIMPECHLYQGGLHRNERRPEKFTRFRGAKVGHQ